MPDVPTGPDRPLPGAPFVASYQRFWQRYAVFSGRASPSEFWWAILANLLVILVLTAFVVVAVIAGAVLRDAGSPAQAVPNALAGVFGLLLGAYVLGQIVPGIAVTVRRLHDGGFSGWLYLLRLAPGVGGLILLVFEVLPSDPAGARYDHGAAPWAPATGHPVPSPSGRPLATPVAAIPQPQRFDSWPPTAPVPQAPQRTPATDPVRRAWSATGAVREVDTRVAGQSSWKRVSYLLVDRPDGVGVLTTSGLASAEGAAALGPGAEVYLPSTALAGPGARADGWELALVAAVARRIGASGMHLPSELDQHGVLSMAVPVAAPDGWRAPDGAVGVLIGLPLAGVPGAVATPGGEVRLVGLAPLRPAELQRILDGGREARGAIAGALHALPATTLASPDRPSV